jgi:hypothetical protein
VVEVMRKMKCARSNADPCLFFKWHPIYGLVLWLKWIDDKLCIANPERVQTEKEEIKKHFQCDDVGAVKDYIGCKTEINTEERYVKSKA